MSKQINRRTFVTSTAMSSMGLFLGGKLAGAAPTNGFSSLLEADSSSDIMKEVMKYRKIDSHVHVGFSKDSQKALLDIADRLGIDRLMISAPGWNTPDDFRKGNDLVIGLMKEYPKQFIGMMALNPNYKQESLEEIKRCVDAGMAGTRELYYQVKINDPLYYPIIEKFIDLKMLIHMHSTIGKSRVILDNTEPENISLPEDFVDIAKRYPEAIFQFAHIGGGIDWEYACKTLSDSPNIYVDVSGSNNEAGVIDFALEYIGEDRLWFGCDNNFYQGVGHMFGDNLTDIQRKKIFFDNVNSILKKSGNNVD